ncbi:hypothetical protein, partial [Mycobacterium avium]|uniref:hypothetical protein n=1 Tax=Mycobacterium avium TaxID=1764 RepID=UPI001C306FC5
MVIIEDTQARYSQTACVRDASRASDTRARIFDRAVNNGVHRRGARIPYRHNRVASRGRGGGP